MSRREFCGTIVAGTLGIVGHGQANDASRLANRFSTYALADYEEDVATNGLRATWTAICRHVLEHGESGILKVCDFGELYEAGLAQQDKNLKKDSGQYYTPPDVADVMATWFDRQKGTDVCDVGCGVGNLILAYLRTIGRTRARKLLKAGCVHLYDLDATALEICVTSILYLYGKDLRDSIDVCCGDFLNCAVTLPPKCKVIANPPYAAIGTIEDSWPHSEVIARTRELYAAFMEKIMRQSAASVIITPYSFIGGTKFFPLRLTMNRHNGFVVSFDNVPGTIFCGRKYGVFNSNKGNSVRAAITVVEDDAGKRGFRFSHLIRFKATERSRLLNCETLEKFIGSRRQVVDVRRPMFSKCDRRLENVFDAWLEKSGKPLGLYVGETGKYEMSVPNTCRYFTAASESTLERKGQIVLRFEEKDVFDYAFCMVNSSFAYWYWRIYDGGITYPKGLLLRMPCFYERLTKEDRRFFRRTKEEMVARAREFVVVKSNVGFQENLKYPREYRDRINARMLKILGQDIDARIFDLVHSNMALEVSV